MRDGHARDADAAAHVAQGRATCGRKQGARGRNEAGRCVCEARAVAKAWDAAKEGRRTWQDKVGTKPTSDVAGVREEDGRSENDGMGGKRRKGRNCMRVVHA